MNGRFHGELKLYRENMYDYYKDKEIECSTKNCGVFVWTAGEQDFMNRLLQDGKVDSVTPPKRCPQCRAQRKRQFNREH